MYSVLSWSHVVWPARTTECTGGARRSQNVCRVTSTQEVWINGFILRYWFATIPRTRRKLREFHTNVNNVQLHYVQLTVYFAKTRPSLASTRCSASESLLLATVYCDNRKYILSYVVLVVVHCLTHSKSMNGSLSLCSWCASIEPIITGSTRRGFKLV